jgi:hypothetical protein
MQICTISVHVHLHVYVYVHVCGIVFTWGRRGVQGLWFLLLCWHSSVMLAHHGTPASQWRLSCHLPLRPMAV